MLQTTAMSAAAERMSGVDRAWLLMDRPSNPMTVIGLLVLKLPLAPKRLRALIAARFLAHQRFRCVPVTDVLGGSWVESPHFALDDHLVCVALPEPAGQAQLEAFVGELASTPFSRDRPLWSFHLVERYQGGCALIVRIHHCYADGVALIHVLLSLCNESLDDAPARSASSATSGDLAQRIPALIGQTLRGGMDLLESSVHYLLHPAELVGVAGEAMGFATELTHIAMMADDPATSLRRPLSGVRRAAWASAIALEEVRMIGHLLGYTVNDVLISTLSGALGRHLERCGDPVAGSIRAAVPVNLRPTDDQSTLGNRFGLVFIDLPIGIRDPLLRLSTVHESMQSLKGSRQALMTYGILAAVGTLPSPAEDPAVAIFSSKASLVASNLAGPREPLRLAGIAVSQILFWVPQAGSIGTGVSMLTYHGQVQFGVLADRQLIPDPGELVAEIFAEFERLLYLVLLGSAQLLN